MSQVTFGPSEQLLLRELARGENEIDAFDVYAHFRFSAGEISSAIATLRLLGLLGEGDSRLKLTQAGREYAIRNSSKIWSGSVEYRWKTVPESFRRDGGATFLYCPPEMRRIASIPSK